MDSVSEGKDGGRQVERRSRDRPRQSTSFVPVPASFVPRAASLLTPQSVRPRAATFPYISSAERERERLAPITAADV